MRVVNIIQEVLGTFLYMGVTAFIFVLMSRWLIARFFFHLGSFTKGAYIPALVVFTLLILSKLLFLVYTVGTSTICLIHRQRMAVKGGSKLDSLPLWPSERWV